MNLSEFPWAAAFFPRKYPACPGDGQRRAIRSWFTGTGSIVAAILPRLNSPICSCGSFEPAFAGCGDVNAQRLAGIVKCVVNLSSILRLLCRPIETGGGKCEI